MMKYTLLALTIALLAILGLAAPVMADPPPGSDNVTIWHGDTANVSLTSDELTITTDGEIAVTGLEDFFDDIFLFILAVALTAYAVVKKNRAGEPSIYARAVVGVFDVIYGLRLADTGTVYSSIWFAGVVIAFIGAALFLEQPIENLYMKVKKWVNEKR